jgi:hypothetical protein
MQGTNFTELDLIFGGENGLLFEFDNRKSTDRIILVTRKAGSVSGREIHTGKHPNKDPELGIVVSGTVEFYCKDADGNEVTARYDNPVQYTFHKNIYHELRAITDIIFIEFNAATDGKDDSMTSF